MNTIKSLRHYFKNLTNKASENKVFLFALGVLLGEWFTPVDTILSMSVFFWFITFLFASIGLYFVHLWRKINADVYDEF